MTREAAPPHAPDAAAPPRGEGPDDSSSAPVALETELKLALPSADHYERLRRALPPPARRVSQHNLFLDTSDLALSGGHWALRMRLEREPQPNREVALLALKGPPRRHAGATHRVDIEAEVPLDLWTRLERDRRISLEELTGPAADHARGLLGRNRDLTVRIGFENLRLVHRLAIAGAERELLVDRTAYDTGELDHEIELELSLPGAFEDPASRELVAAVEEALTALLEAAGVSAAPSTQGKLSRGLSYARRR